MRQEILYSYFYDKAFKMNKPVSVMIELMTKCNLRCEHCYIPSFTNNGLSFERVKNLLLEFKELGIVNVSLTGGEILLRKDLLDIIRVARSLHMRVFLLSNGTLLNEDIVNELSKLYISEFSTTIFSMNNEIHDSITGRKGSLDELLKNLSLFEKTNIRVQIKTPLMKKNLLDLNDVKNYCEEKGFNYEVSPLIISKSDGDTTPQKYSIQRSELASVMKTVDSISRNNHLHEKDVPCDALFYSFAIDCNGDVHPCNSFFYKVGNIFENSLKEIWYNSEELEKVKSIKNSDIKVCSSCAYAKYCDRCPALVFMDSKDFHSCDIFAKKLAMIRASNYCTG